jgi:hypothetical protein
MPRKIKILFFSAEPTTLTSLRLGQEVRDIEDRLHRAPQGRSFQLITQWAVRPGDLAEILLRYRPDIVHFSGHSSGGKIMLEGEAGQERPIEGEHLTNLLTTFGDTIRLVVFNACYSSMGFFNLIRKIDYVVGTTDALSDDAAISFSSCFYQALAFGRSVSTAFELARQHTNIENFPEAKIFNLLAKDGINLSEPFIKPRSTGSAQPKKPARQTTENQAQAVDPAATFIQNIKPGNSTTEIPRNMRGITEHIPAQIKESLEHFRVDYPDQLKVAFLMMRFGTTKAHENIVAAIKKALDPIGITVVRADDKQYNDDLFPNVLTYMHGCGFGIAVFERIESEEFNPNVALEVGYMLALRKEVCLLKDRTLKTLHADLVGKLYKIFDPLDPLETIPKELSRWLQDKGLQEGT